MIDMAKSGTKEYQQEYYKKHKERHKLHARLSYHKYKNCPKHKEKAWERMLFRQYGITLEEYTQLLVKQNYVCAICKYPEKFSSKSGKIKRLAVDHCHKTKKIRSLLCFSCNAVLGLINDNILILSEMKKYLHFFIKFT